MKKIEDELIRAMMDQHVNEGRELFGKDGMIQELTKRMMEKMLEAELEDHLGYARGERGSERRDNTRNGTSSKRVRTDNGEIPIDVPRDREGSFEPQLVKKHQRRLAGFDDRVLSLYAKGMSTRDIQQHLTEVYGTEISPQLVTRVTHAVLEDIREWRSRPLQAVWPIVYLDALVIRVREGGVVRRKSVYLAIGVGVEGTKEVLGMWLEETEGAKFWLRVINELKSRGIEDIFIACVDGLKGFPQAIEAVFPKTTVQTCIVHMIRNSTRFVNYKDRKAVAAALKPIYTAINRDEAATSLEGFEEAWGAKYPMIGQSWRAHWEQVVPFLDFPAEVRRILYTTNAIESFNARVRKLVNGKGHFPNDDAAVKLIYLAVQAAERKWTRPCKGWKSALHQFAIHFEGRLPV